MNVYFMLMSIALMFIGLASFEGSGGYILLGCLAIAASVFLFTITIRQYIRDQTIAQWPYYVRDQNTGGWGRGAFMDSSLGSWPAV